MPLDATKLDELKANIAFARKRPMAFGLCIGKSPETTVLLGHKTKDPETVGRQAKKEGETSKIAFGLMTVEGKNLNLACQGDVISGLARKAKEMLKAAGVKMKVRILDAEGNVLEELGDPEDEEEDGDTTAAGLAANLASDPAAAPPDPQKAKWADTRPKVEDALARVAAAGKTDLTQPKATWAGALAKAAAENFAGALQDAANTVKQIGAAVAAGRVVEDDRTRWLAAAASFQPDIDAMAGSGTPEAKKLSAFWSFAQSKANAPVPDFAAALKSLPLIAKMISEIRAKLAVAMATATPAAPAPEGTNGAPPVTPEENARLANLSDEELAKTDLTLGDTKELFSDEYMLSLKDAPIKGEGDPNLKELMREIEKGLSGSRRAEVMEELSQIVGVPPSAAELDADYDRFLIVKKQQEVKGKTKGEASPELDEEMHPDFRGSRSQLMFGKVLGDAFGIHEVFAALLSPTGGLVGPGNWLIEPGGMVLEDGIKAGHLDPDNPVALHGTVHDAAGYLNTFHDDGPGYNYLDSMIEILGPDSPLSGQVSGILYWAKEAGPDYIEKRVDAVVIEVEKQLKSTRDAVAAEVQRRMAEAKQKIDEGIDAAKDLAEAAGEAAVDVAVAIKDAAVEAEKQLRAAPDAAAAEIQRGLAAAKKKADQAVAAAKKLAEAAERQAVEVADAIKDAAAEAEKAAVETFEAGSRKVGEVKEEAKRKLEAAWDFIWS